MYLSSTQAVVLTRCNRLISSCLNLRIASACSCSNSSCCLRSATSRICYKRKRAVFKSSVVRSKKNNKCSVSEPSSTVPLGPALGSPVWHGVSGSPRELNCVERSLQRDLPSAPHSQPESEKQQQVNGLDHFVWISQFLDPLSWFWSSFLIVLRFYSTATWNLQQLLASDFLDSQITKLVSISYDSIKNKYTSLIIASYLRMFNVCFTPLWQKTEYLWVVQKTRYLRMSSWAFDNQTTNQLRR